MEGEQGAWRFSGRERIWIAVALVVIMVFAAVLERRTALRRMPMTDLGVFCTAAAAVKEGDRLYAVSDCHGWHYQYPPFFAVLFRPFAHRSAPIPSLPPGVSRTSANTPWPYLTGDGKAFYGLHRDNLGFFIAVLVWYLLSVLFTVIAGHLLACVLEGVRWNSPLPVDDTRRDWWKRRLLPLLLCLGSIGTDFSRGQVDTLMLLAVAAGVYSLFHGRAFWAGGWFSLPVCIKLFPPFLLLLPLWQRSRSLIAGSALGLVICLVGVPLLAMGPERMVDAYAQWQEVLAKPALGAGRDVSRAEELTNVNASDNQSLLAFLHNWGHRHLPRGERPAQASQVARVLSYVLGVGMFIAWVVGTGLEQPGSPRQLLIVTGTLIVAAFVVSPIVHQYYYLMLLPLLAALVDFCMRRPDRALRGGFVPASLGLFFVVDFLAPFPVVGPLLKDWGLPLISLLLLTLAGLRVLRGERSSATGGPAGTAQG